MNSHGVCCNKWKTSNTLKAYPEDPKACLPCVPLNVHFHAIGPKRKETWA